MTNRSFIRPNRFAEFTPPPDSREKLLYDDTTALKQSMKKRRVMGTMGKHLQRRFRDYDLGDAMLYALHGIMPDDYSGDVSLQKEEFEAILLKARVPISQEELRWVVRTFTVPDEDDRGFRLNRLEAAPLINFALGVSDPWQETGSLEEISSMVCFIASKPCSFTTGFIFDATGGRATY